MAGAPGRIPAKAQSRTTPLGPAVGGKSNERSTDSRPKAQAALGVRVSTLAVAAIPLLLLVVVVVLAWSFRTGKNKAPALPVSSASIGTEPARATVQAPVPSVSVQQAGEAPSTPSVSEPIRPMGSASATPSTGVVEAGVKKPVGAKKPVAPRGESPNVLP
jgi:hypothetical protein